MMIRTILTATALATMPGALLAQTVPAAATLSAAPIASAAPTSSKPPVQLTADQRTAYRAIFAAIRSSDWTAATAGLDALPDGPLTTVARAEMILAKGSPKVDDATIASLLIAGRDLPEAPQIARLASARGLTVPALPLARDMVRMAGPPKRRGAQSLRNDRAAAALAQQIGPLVKGDRPSDAEAILTARLAELSPEAQTEWLQRVAWAYYLSGDDANALRVATQARNGAGEWAVQADWVAGLAAWRSKDCNTAATSFDAVASRARDAEMIAAGLYWTTRADTVCGRPERVQPRLRTAARMKETFYGMIAQASLGIADSVNGGIRMTASDWTAIGSVANVRRAAALAEIDEMALADQHLRYQARIGLSGDHEALIHLAAGLNLPSTQIWLAQNGPSGASLSASARYPTPGWTPASGWQVDKSLVYAHALQESQFRPDATSSAGARGVMQLMPGTAQMVARHQGRTIDMATLGQQYLRELADNSGTAGLLPKVIAAYNAGPNSVANWNARGRNLADPLLFIESIPFTETRAYVAIVLRNYWMYQRQDGAKAASLSAMAQGLWPRFPGLPGRDAVRLSALGTTAGAD